MGMRKWILGLWMSLLLGPLCCGVAWAKPAGLPVPCQRDCADGKDGKDGKDDKEHGSMSITIDLLTGRISVDFTTDTDPPAMIDAVCPSVLPALLEQILTQAGNALSQPQPPATVQEKMAQRMFRDAEDCARRGQLEKARLLYQQVHVLAPTSSIGRKAIDRLQQVEERMRDSAEESSDPPSTAPDPEANFRNLRDRTIPLGLVVVSY